MTLCGGFTNAESTLHSQQYLKAGNDCPRSIHPLGFEYLKRVQQVATLQHLLQLEPPSPLHPDTIPVLDQTYRSCRGGLGSYSNLYPKTRSTLTISHGCTGPPHTSLAPSDPLTSRTPPRSHRSDRHRSSTMCTTNYFKSRACQHAWMTIKKPCAEGKNFSNCESFKDGRARARTPPGQWAPPKSCPWCDLKGAYDANTTRVVTKVTTGVRLCSYDASRRGPGIDVVCCAVM